MLQEIIEMCRYILLSSKKEFKIQIVCMYVFICIHFYLKEVYVHIHVQNRIIYNLIFCVKGNLKFEENRKNINSVIQSSDIVRSVEKNKKCQKW